MKDYARPKGLNFSVYFPDDEHDALMEIVHATGRPRAAVIRDAVREHVKRARRRTVKQPALDGPEPGPSPASPKARTARRRR